MRRGGQSPVDITGIERNAPKSVLLETVLPALSSARIPLNSLPLPGSTAGGSAHLTLS
jgi:hypothetical protein